MIQGWEIKKLSEICVSSNGLWKGKNPPFTTIAVLRSTNFTKDCKIKLDDVAYIEVEEKSFAKRRLQKNDIVVERSGGGPNQPVGRVLLFDIEDENYSFCNFTSALRVLDTTIVSPIYLHRYLTYFYLSGQTINIQSNTIGLRNLDYTKYLDISIPVPPIAEQQRIVEILDREFEKIDALKANAERSLQQAKDLFQSALKQELQPKEGWKTKTINELSEQLFAGGDVPKNAMSKTKTEEYDVPIYANAVENNGLYGYTNIARVYTPSITIAGRGSGTGYVIERTEPYLPVVRLIVIVPQESEVKNRFLYYALKSLNIKSNGSAIPQLTVPMIAQYSINYPKIELQDYIIKKLDILNEHCKAVEENYTKTMALCDDMKQALLRQAFNGEL